jgi:hypothetical protein
MRKVTIGILFLLFLICTSMNSQSEEMQRHPGWAIIATAVLPGGGQFYAENYGRGIFFSSLQISLLTLTVYEKVQETDYKKLYDENPSKDIWDQYNKHKSRVRNLLWWDAGIWFLACADAFADAHFYKFGEEEKVSLDLETKEESIHVGFTVKF